MAGRRAPLLSGVRSFMAGCRAPMLQVDVPPWLVPVSFWLVLLSFLVAGGCVPVAGGASWHPRPHIHSRAPWRVRTSLLSAAGTRRRNPSFKGIKMKGYCSIYQLFKISSWVALYKSFMNRNLTKTLFSIDYRGYFIIQAHIQP